jgi:pSer/pThr/pTyr-binding forkhead associated (FHA) protein
VLDEDVILLGRDKTCQVQLTEQAVSRTHARISRDGALFFVEDMGSSYGTKLNGKGLPKGEKRLLHNGDTIAIAQYDVVFDRVTEAPKTDGAHDKTSMISRQVMKDALRGIAQTEGPYFRVMNGPKEGQRIELSGAQELVFGRDEDVDVVLTDDLVSRQHAKVRRDWSGTHVEDLQSRNGIKVNKKRVLRKTLKDSDELEIGGLRLLYLDPSDVRETPVVMDSEGEATVAAKEEESKAAAPNPAEPPPPAEAPAPGEVPAGTALPPPEGAAPADDPPSGTGEGSTRDAPQEDAPFDSGMDPSGDPGDAAPAPANGLLARFAALTGLEQSKAIAPLVIVGIAAVVAIVIIIALVAGA